MTDRIAEIEATIQEALDAAYHISECADHPEHLAEAEDAARRAFPALAELAKIARKQQSLIDEVPGILKARSVYIGMSQDSDDDMPNWTDWLKQSSTIGME